MTVVALASAKGSPGVTTLALALAHVWPRPVLLAECDPAGGDVAAGFLAAAADPGRGLLDLTVAARRADLATALGGHLLALDGTGTRLLLAGLSDPAQAAVVAGWWDRLATLFTALGTPGGPAPPSGAGAGGVAGGGLDVLADCGRLAAAHPPTPVLRRADTVLVVLRPTLRGIAQARAAVAGLRTGDPTVDRRLLAVPVGAGSPYPPREVARALGVPVVPVAADARAAAVFSDGAPARRRFAASGLLRSARTLADRLTDPHSHRRAEPPTALPGLPGPAGNGQRPAAAPDAAAARSGGGRP